LFGGKTPIADFLGDLGKLLQMFFAGLEIDLEQFRKARNKSILFGVITTSLPLILGTAVGLWSGYQFIPAIVIGSLLASHTLLSMPILIRLDATRLEPVSPVGAGSELRQYRGDLMAISDQVCADLGLPDRDGFAALEEMRAHHPKIPIVILSASCDRDNVVKALNLGAVGFIPKSGEREVMLSALRLVFSGGVYIPPEILSYSEVPSGLGPSLTSGRRLEGPAPASPADLGLTSRQVDVLALMMRGKSNKAICRILDLAEPTVKNHVTAILKALKVSNRTEAVIMVGGLGWELPRFDS
jgi:DNA-binding NarL/FixJ family response regulator